jgi:uncharacterized peroxidase-related enzyme
MRIKRLEPFEATGETKQIFDLYLKERGNVPNMFRTVAHRPEYLRTMIAHFRTVMSTGTVSAKLKELLFVRVSQINHCEYWLNSHSALAERHGYTRDQIEHAADFATRTDFTEEERVALRFAERVTYDSNNVDEKLWADLRAHFDEGQIVELTAAVGLFNYFNRFNNALQIEPTK